jgi:hypothetical protein
MAAITVKKADGTTDIVYSNMTPSGGDKVPAVWRSESVGASANLRPTLQLVSEWNGPRTARRITASYQYPYTVTDSTTSTTTVKARIPFTIQGTVPAEVPDDIVAEACAQVANLFDSTLIQDSFKSGFAPN